jgi:hypothetical protein
MASPAATTKAATCSRRFIIEAADRHSIPSLPDV